MRKRTQAREFALQLLYALDITKENFSCLWENFCVNQEKKLDAQVKEFAQRLIEGVIAHKDEIDAKISAYAKNWELKRMPTIDRNILRLGIFELMFCPDIPSKVSINEAIDLAKKYSGICAGKFANGILDKVKLSLNKA